MNTKLTVLDIVKGVLFFLFLIICYEFITNFYIYMFINLLIRTNSLITILIIVFMIIIAGLVFSFSKTIEFGFSGRFISKSGIAKEGDETPEAISNLPSVLFKDIAEKSDEKNNHINKTNGK